MQTLATGPPAPCALAHLLRAPPARARTGNMMLFDHEGVIRKYDTPEDILRDFFDLRLAYYGKRKAALLKVRRRGGGGVGWWHAQTELQEDRIVCRGQGGLWQSLWRLPGQLPIYWVGAGFSPATPCVRALR